MATSPTQFTRKKIKFKLSYRLAYESQAPVDLQHINIWSTGLRPKWSSFIHLQCSAGGSFHLCHNWLLIPGGFNNLLFNVYIPSSSAGRWPCMANSESGLKIWYSCYFRTEMWKQQISDFNLRYLECLEFITWTNDEFNSLARMRAPGLFYKSSIIDGKWRGKKPFEDKRKDIWRGKGTNDCKMFIYLTYSSFLEVR